MAGKKASISINILADAAKAKAGFAEAERAATGLDKQFAAIAKTAVNAFATQQIVNFGKQAVNSASDLAESANAVAVTFEDAADGILALGENASKTVGLSAKDFNAFAVQFAGFTRQLTDSERDIVDVTDELTTRVADFASVMNLDVPQAAQVFQSSLAGETEPIKKFGIDLSAAAVQAYALANGISESAASMTEAEKVQARYGLLMESTAKMSGDFANTSDGLANQQRILAAELENVKATVGEAMVPALQALMGAIGPVLDAFTALPEGLQQAVVLAGAGAVGFKSFSNTLQGFGLSAKNANKFVGGLTVGLGAAMLAFNEYSTAKSEMAAAADRVRKALNAETLAVQDNSEQLIRQELIAGEVGDALEMLGLNAGDFAAAIIDGGQARRDFIVALDDAKEASTGLGDGLRSLFTSEMTAVDAARIVQREFSGMSDGFDAAGREAARMSEEQERLARESTYTAHAIDELATITDTATEAADAFSEQFATSSGKVVEFGWNVKQAKYELDAFYGRLSAEDELAKFNEDMDAIQAELAQLVEGSEEYAAKFREAQLLVGGLSDQLNKLPDQLELNLVAGGDFDRIQRILGILTGPETYSATGQEEMSFLRTGIAPASMAGTVNMNVTVNMPAGSNGRDVVDTIEKETRRFGALSGSFSGNVARR